MFKAHKVGRGSKSGQQRLLRLTPKGGYRGNFRRDPSQLEFQLQREAARAALVA